MLSTGFLVGGDFNLIRSPNEKSNDRFVVGGLCCLTLALSP